VGNFKGDSEVVSDEITKCVPAVKTAVGSLTIVGGGVDHGKFHEEWRKMSGGFLFWRGELSALLFTHS